ncbi:tetratricopeptide repeat protein 12 isoform X2 [Hoplias malabaricus]|uniref:tetratricopeptide repeat protein 12 isoform X2 n=1 Tax=Hoplias malabaricus TaxID=27720 RepID=UPI003462561A
MAMNDSEDLEKFLTNIDKISELVKELSSSDVATQEKAVEKAEHFVVSLEEEKTCKTRLNRTVINKNPSCETLPMNAAYESSPSPENFMKALEKDALERRKRRQAKEERAKALKEKGNKAFALGDYEVAVKFYTEGLEQLRDMQTLYTNRAQALIKLQKYKEAINDCEWALKCNDKCIKAHVHMGRAHLALKNFAKSRWCYEKILDIEPEREAMVKDYLTQVDLEEKKTLQEKIAREELKEGKAGVTMVPDLLRKLDRSREMCTYYCGGVELLSQAIKDKENQQLLLQCPSTREQIVQLLASPVSIIQQACLALLCMYSQTQHGRLLVIEHLSLHRMVESLMDCVCRDVTSGTVVLTVLEDLAGENKFQMQFRENFAELFSSSFEHLLGNVSACSQDMVLSLISVIGTMCQDETISNKMASSEEFWRSAFSAMGRSTICEYRNILYPLLGLMINIASNPAPVNQEQAVVGCSRCVVLLSDPDGDIITRAAGLLSVVLPKSVAAIQETVQQGVVKRLLKILKGAGLTSSRYSIKALAVCTASSQQACEELVKFDKRLVTLRKLLGSSDEVVVGNTALCLGHCVAVQGAATGLLNTDSVQLLLRHAAGNTSRSAVQQNAAIALGKLCRADQRHMAKLRELHGLEILHSCMKLIT